jgi:hypothetical protein
VAYAIALRAALVLLGMRNLGAQTTAPYWSPDYFLRAFRAISISRIATIYSAHETAATDASARAAAEIAAYSRHLKTLPAFGADSSQISEFVSFFGDLQTAGGNHLWSLVSRDCEYIDNFISTDNPASALLLLPITSDYVQDISSYLQNIGMGFDVWLNWFDRVYSGDVSGFGLAPKAEYALSLRLTKATDEWWNREPALVNAEVQGWIDELTSPKTAATLADLEAEPQSSRSPQFKTDASGRIAIDGTANAYQVRDDREAISRHAAAKDLAETLQSTLQGHNYAGYIADQTADYLEALGQGLGDIQPSMMVLHGERLRQSIAAHQNAGPNDSLQPLPEVASRDAMGLLAAHNMLVGLDPYLNQLDRAVLGPDVKESLVSPDEVRTIAQETSDDGILAPETKAIMDEAADLAPALPDLANRNSRFLTGLAQNFARYGIELLRTYPTEAAWLSVLGGGAAVATFGVAVTAGGIGSAYFFGRNILANEAVYRKWAGSSPATVANMDKLIAFLKTLPLNSMKG